LKTVVSNGFLKNGVFPARHLIPAPQKPLEILNRRVKRQVARDGKRGYKTDSRGTALNTPVFL
jgi:hypothetical protein